MSQTADYRPHGTPLREADRVWLESIADEFGVAEGARRVGLSRLAFVSGIAGVPVLPGTHAIVRERRRELADRFGVDG